MQDLRESVRWKKQKRSRFLNCTNGTKSRNAPQIDGEKIGAIVSCYCVWVTNLLQKESNIGNRTTKLHLQLPRMCTGMYRTLSFKKCCGWNLGRRIQSFICRFLEFSWSSTFIKYKIVDSYELCKLTIFIIMITKKFNILKNDNGLNWKISVENFV